MKDKGLRIRAPAIAVALLSCACSPQKMALNRMASALANSTSVYEADNDPEFVRLAAPSTLKTVEMLLSQNPDHPQLLLTACSGFTEYSYGFLHVESELRAADVPASLELKSRAARRYAREARLLSARTEPAPLGITEATLISSSENASRDDGRHARSIGRCVMGRRAGRGSPIGCFAFRNSRACAR